MVKVSSRVIFFRYLNYCKLNTICLHFDKKEKLKGKNKLAPRLLGITRDSVLRVDEKTKEVRMCYRNFLLSYEMHSYKSYFFPRSLNHGPLQLSEDGLHRRIALLLYA